MMNSNRSPLASLLAFAALVEAATGLALLADPALVALLLLGAEPTGIGAPLGRCFGIALLALGLACWPAPAQDPGGSAAWRAMLAYNALIALYLPYVALSHGIHGIHGMLTWPAVALHAGMALLLLWFRVRARLRLASAP
jgi:hypothetical protein